LLNWTVRDLAERAGVHRNTVTRVETDATAPGHSIAAIRAALESASVIFLDDGKSIDGGPGVRLMRIEPVTTDL
jgi:transcriptional regulator with XRE-family HTH domain